MDIPKECIAILQMWLNNNKLFRPNKGIQYYDKTEEYLNWYNATQNDPEPDWERTW